jgi:hypothetical protein
VNIGADGYSCRIGNGRDILRLSTKDLRIWVLLFGDLLISQRQYSAGYSWLLRKVVSINWHLHVILVISLSKILKVHQTYENQFTWTGCTGYGHSIASPQWPRMSINCRLLPRIDKSIF